MYIVVNKFPIDVYKISSISRICSISENTYESVLRAYVKWKRKADPNFEGTLVSVAREHKNTKESDYKFYNTYFKRLDEVLKAVTGKGLIREPDYMLSMQSLYGAQSSDAGSARFLNAGEINWSILPDTYFFSINYSTEIFFGPRSAGTGTQLFSEFYDSEDDATRARDELLRAINTVRYETIKLDI